MLKQDEKTLIVLAQQGDMKAKDSILKLYEKLIHSIINSFKIKKQEDKDDLFQEGWRGLNAATNKFNPELGFALSTYASYYIKKYMALWIMNDRNIHIPKNVFQNIIKPKTEEEKLLSAMYLNDTTSGDVRIGEDEDSCTLFDLVADTRDGFQDFYNAEAIKALNDAIAKLPEREANIIKLKHGIGCDKVMVKDMVVELDMSKPTLYRGEEKAFEILRKDKVLLEWYNACA